MDVIICLLSVKNTKFQTNQALPTCYLHCLVFQLTLITQKKIVKKKIWTHSNEVFVI